MCPCVHQAIEDFSAVIKASPTNAHALFRRGFAFKSLKKYVTVRLTLSSRCSFPEWRLRVTCRYDMAANDFETARLLDPKNPNLVVNYSQLHTLECVVLCPAGQEPDFEVL